MNTDVMKRERNRPINYGLEVSDLTFIKPGVPDVTREMCLHICLCSSLGG